MSRRRGASSLNSPPSIATSWSPSHQLQEKQRIASADDDDADVFGYHYENGMLAVNLFHMRGGKIVDRREFFWEDLPDFIDETLPECGASRCDDSGAASRQPFDAGCFFSALLKQLYLDQPYVPRTFYVPVDFSDRATWPAADRTHRPPRRNRASRSVAKSVRWSTLPARTPSSRYDQRFRVLAAHRVKPSRKRCRTRSPWKSCPAASSASTSRTSRARRPSPHGGLGRRRDEEVATTANSRSKPSTGVDDFASMREVVTPPLPAPSKKKRSPCRR